MRCLSTMLLLSLLFISASVSAQNYPAKPAASPVASPGPVKSCPWLTEGSAAAALGGSVNAALNVVSAVEGTCTFTKKDSPSVQLKVIVGPAHIPSCPVGSSSVAGIGTQASRCHMLASRDLSNEMISGKVRAVSLAVTLSGIANTSSTSLDYRHPLTIDEIAEQVAGNLF